MASTNGAASFSPLAMAFQPAADFGFRYGGDGGMTLSATPGMEDDLWFASPSQGLFHRVGGTADFIKIASVQEADFLGLGRAAPGKNLPTLFLYGRIGGLQALFRSDDVGQNWVRINDDQHQFRYQGLKILKSDKSRWKNLNTQRKHRIMIRASAAWVLARQSTNPTSATAGSN